MAKTLEELLAKDSIRDLVLKYSRAVDRHDFDLLATLYHEDSIDDHGGMFYGTGPEYLEWLPMVVESMEVLSHQVMNHLIVVDETGEYAEGEVYIQAYHLMPGGEDQEELVIGGRYLDKYAKRDGEWRFAHRKIVLDWHQMQMARRQPDSPVLAGTPLGDRIDKDPSKAFFSLF
jgi:ketosteroid isomerase-like protein